MKNIILVIIILNVLFLLYFLKNKIIENFNEENKLNNIIINNDTNEFINYIITNKLISTIFKNKNFICNIIKYKKFIKYVRSIEIEINRHYSESIIYKTLPNIIDTDYRIRNYYNWKCEICNIDCINNKDLLDIHTKSLGIFNKNILNKNDIIICCRLCHYNIDPKDHKNLRKLVKR